MRYLVCGMPVVLLFAAGCTLEGAAQEDEPPLAADASSQEDLAVATFAGGCFWCVAEAFDEIEGVRATISGYTGGHVESPTYEQVSAGGTGHSEAVLVRYDPDVVSYAELLFQFWRNTPSVAEHRTPSTRGGAS